VVVVIGCRRLGSKTPRSERFWRIVSAVMAEAVMVVGYFLYEALVLKYGWAAAANIPFNAVQGSLGIVLAIAVYELLIRAGIQIGKK